MMLPVRQLFSVACCVWLVLLGCRPAASDSTPARHSDGSCSVFPNSHWDVDVSSLPVHPSSASIMQNINDDDQERGMHADFAGHTGAGATTIYYGIPFMTVDSSASGASFPPGPTDFYMYKSESDTSAGVPPGSGRYPFPINAPVEGAYTGCSVASCGGDRHVLVVDNATCTLYEVWRGEPPANNAAPWRAANGAAFSLSNPLLPQRPLGWTSADAAGLPIYPGLVKASEVAAGEVKHAIRFTARYVKAAYEYPASHLVTNQGTTPNRPWMGMRARLSSSFNCDSTLTTPEAKVICTAMKRYGVILADVGSPWYLTGEATAAWESLLGSRLGQFHSDIVKMQGKFMEVVMPPGHCLCTQPNCKNSQGTPMCASPKLPSEYPPPPSPPPASSPGPDPAQPPAVKQLDGSCAVLPGSHFTMDVSGLPLHPDSSNIVAYISEGNTAMGMHADFAGHDGPVNTNTIYYGIPFLTVDSRPSKQQAFNPGPTDFYLYPSESDLTAGVPAGSGRYPFPADATIEGAYPGCTMTDCDTDRHVLVVDNFTCTLYEAWRCQAPANELAPWSCANGAAFNLSDPLLPQRPIGWTSADAAGLPIYPGLVRVDEVSAGEVKHAIRFTSRRIRDAYAWPASHLITGQGGVGPYRPWMGLRARLSAAFKCSNLYTKEAQVICRAMQKYGLILADAGRPWFLTGEASPGWEVLLGANLTAFRNDISSITAANMEVVTPPGHCLCTIAECLNDDGTVQCLPAEVPGTQHSTPQGTRLVVQTDRSIPRLDGSTNPAYNGTIDAGITTQYSAAWNNYQGVTYYWGTPELPVSDDTGSAHESFRVLLRFEKLFQFLPAAATINQASLNLTFINWGPGTHTLEVCALTKPWVATPPAVSYSGLGWQKTGAGAAAWSQPGGWADCSTAWSVPVPPGHPQSGYIQVALPLPASVLLGWVANNGASNYGVLMRSKTGNINLRMSQHMSKASTRPALDIYYDGPITWSPEPDPSPPPSPSPDAFQDNTPQPPAQRLPDGSCAVLPGSAYQLDVSSLPLHSYSAALISSINDGNPSRSIHPDFASTTDTGAGIIPDGIPFITVDSNPAKAQQFPPGPTVFNMYPTESDVTAGVPRGSGRYPFPANAPIEGAYPGCSIADCDTDRHVLVVDNYTCTLYEAWRCEWPTSATAPWTCANGAAFNLSNPLLPQRPFGWTSADAAGLPIYAGLIKVAEIQAGAINHAIRFTARVIQPAFAWPASHLVTGHGTRAPETPWMGLRARLRSSYSCNASLQTPAARIICTAMQKYGLILSDIGGGWYVTGEASASWSDVIPASQMAAFQADMGKMRGSDMEVVMPPGHCLCWNAQCLEVLGTKTCPDPVVPGTPSLPAPTGKRVVLQTGRSVAALDGSTVASYNGTIDAGITTQYIASWNNMQGVGYYWPTAADRIIKEATTAAGETFRVVLRFDELYKFVPSGAVITSAALNMTFLNWQVGITSTVQVCVLQKPWVGSQPAANYAGIGWAKTGVTDSTGNLIGWTAPGAASDCGATWTVDVIPGYEKSGMIQVSLALPGSVIQGWVTKQSTQNYGVLIRCLNGQVSLRPSQLPQYPAARPALDIYYQPGTGGLESPAPSPSPPASDQPPSPSPSPATTSDTPSPSPTNPKPSPSPEPAKPSPSPSPAPQGSGFARLVVKTGLTLSKVDGSSVLYNGTMDAGITTQYIADWNYMQGVTYYWPATPEITLGDAVNSAKENFRVLLQFAKLQQLLPPSAAVTSARLNLTLVNWQSSSQTVQVCALATRWVATSPPTRYVAVGWARTGMFTSSGTPITWAEPGAWKDCSSDPAATWSFTVPCCNGMAKVSVPVPASAVAGWLANNGSANYGLLMRGASTPVTIRLSQHSDTNSRPALDIIYTDTQSSAMALSQTTTTTKSKAQPNPDRKPHHPAASPKPKRSPRASPRPLRSPHAWHSPKP